ncbi:MAG: translation elongation factor Ts [Treponema sp.]|jgi:elongation factor Ts|nr:translation elongation factor Ts [Treponema sp.]
MATISAADVKRLREKTGAGMMECKNALVETDGDFDKAEKLLKEKGLAAVEKRSNRATNEGKVFIKTKDNTAVLVELAAETDFVARNPEFIALGGAIADRVLEKGYTSVNEELSGMVTDLATKIRENMGLKRMQLIKAEANEGLAEYIHGEGSIGVVVKLAVDKPELLAQEAFKELAHGLAMHIAWANPLVIDRNQLDAAFIAEQEEIFRKQMEADENLKGKPAAALDNILKGKISKYLKSLCLLDQGYVKDEKRAVAQILADCGKELGATLTISGYVYFKVGQ